METSCLATLKFFVYGPFSFGHRANYWILFQIYIFSKSFLLPGEHWAEEYGPAHGGKAAPLSLSKDTVQVQDLTTENFGAGLSGDFLLLMSDCTCQDHPGLRMVWTRVEELCQGVISESGLADGSSKGTSIPPTTHGISGSLRTGPKSHF